jgi:thiol-disulfide isomerase/thioredoxin
MSGGRALLAGLMVVGLAAAGFWVHHTVRSRTAAKPAMTRGAAAERVPDLALPDLQGRSRQLSEWQGRPLVINFWATWCGPCRREIPLLQRLREEYAAQGLEVLGIAVDFKEPVAAYVRNETIAYPVLIAADNALVTRSFGVGMGIPTTVFAARDGRILAVKVGQLHGGPARKLIEELLKAP